VRTRLAEGRVIVYKSRGGWIRQGYPSLRTPLLNRAFIFKKKIIFPLPVSTGTVQIMREFWENNESATSNAAPLVLL
jgi:hypothetical protein